MRTFIRQDAMATHQSKVNCSWAVAFFDGAVPENWDSLGFNIGEDLLEAFSACKSAQLFNVKTSTQDFRRVQFEDTGKASAYMPVSRFIEYEGHGYKVIPKSINNLEAFKDNFETYLYSATGSAFNLSLSLDTTKESRGVLGNNLQDSGYLEFEFDYDVSPVELLIHSTSDYRYTLRHFSVEAYDSELDQWTEVLSSTNHYSNRSLEKYYALAESTSRKYRINFLDNSYSNVYSLQEEFAFIVKDKPAVVEEFIPTWCLLFPIRMYTYFWKGAAPAMLASVGSVGSDAEIIVDRDSYSAGQKVRMLTNEFRINNWETL
jgi:hypothetical protein